MTNFHERKNSSCSICSKEKRKQNTSDTLCTRAVGDDGLPIRCVGGWGKEKINFVHRYIDITGSGMKNKWNKLSYVEICSGPGSCIDKDKGVEFDGSPLSILQASGAKYIKSFVFIDNNEKVQNTLRERINKHKGIAQNTKDSVQIVHGDYNKADFLFDAITQHINTGLVVIFIDPTDMSVPFQTIIKLMEIGKADFIINLPIYMDFTRNSKKPLIFANSKARTKYGKVIDDDTFFDDPKYIKFAKNDDNQGIRQLYRERLVSKFNDHGYTNISEKKIDRFYHLLYASRSDKGLDFWNKACLRDSYGQGEFDF